MKCFFFSFFFLSLLMIAIILGRHRFYLYLHAISRKREMSAKSTTSMASNAWTQPANVGGNRVSGVPYADDDVDNFVFSDEEDDEDDQDPTIEYENQAPFPSSFSRSSSRPDSADIPSRPYSSSSASRPLSAARRRYELDDVSDSGLNQMHARRPASSGYVGMDGRKPQQDGLCSYFTFSFSSPILIVLIILIHISDTIKEFRYGGFRSKFVFILL